MNNSSAKYFVPGLAAALMLALSGCAAVEPPDPLDEATPQYEVEYIALTGTRIKDLVEVRRRPSAGALNVTVVTREAIERSGAGTVSEAIRRAR
jgi:outer membrane cobalamin receptor